MTTDLDAALSATAPEPVTSVSTAPMRPHRHRWALTVHWDDARQANVADGTHHCLTCRPLVFRDPVRSRRSRNNGKRGKAAELDVARAVGGRKVGPLGHPWDVEMAGYARLQVRKYATPQGLRAIAAELARIARAPGPEMPGYIWIEPGRGGERLVVFRLRDFSERHGTPHGTLSGDEDEPDTERADRAAAREGR